MVLSDKTPGIAAKCVGLACFEHGVVDLTATKLSPFVFWAQTAQNVTLRINLQNVKNPKLDVTETSLEFSACGIGAKGLNDYHFKLEFCSIINPEASHYKVKEHEVEIVLTKAGNEWWPRLIQEQCRPAWLKVDFDNLKAKEDVVYNEDYYQSFEDPSEKFSDYQFSDFSWRERKSTRKKVEDFRRIYLFLYNLFQFVGFLYIIIVLSLKYAKDGPESTEKAFTAVGSAMKFCGLMQILEIVHPLLGYTSGSAVVPFCQVMGRLVMVFVMVHSEPRMHSKPAVFYLFYTYALVEIVRYPYYMLRVYNAGIGILTWLRYTIWIPLYPLGFICEGVIILRNIPYFEETGKFSVALPNLWNISFYFPTVMRIYLLLGLFPVLYFMMTYMYRQRVKILSATDDEMKRK